MDKENKPKIYISGKITGDPNAKDKFAKAEKHLKELGYCVINPFNIAPKVENPEWEDYMKEDLREMLKHDCNKIYMLDNWRDSDGAKVENWLAELFDYEILGEE